MTKAEQIAKLKDVWDALYAIAKTDKPYLMPKAAEAAAKILQDVVLAMKAEEGM